jgi:hypothetical protein
MSHYIDYQKAKWRGVKAHSEVLAPMGMGDAHPITMMKYDPPIPAPQHFGALNERQQLKSLGVGEVHATLAIPYLYFVPRTSDADAQGVQVIVAALQRKLGVPETGYLGDRTANALAQRSGPDWFDKRWNQLVGDVLTRPAPQATGNYFEVGNVLNTMTQRQKLVFAGAAAIGIYFVVDYFKNAKKGLR